MRTFAVFLAAAFLRLVGAQSSVAAITYVDSTTANTTLNGAPLAPHANYTTGKSDGAMDNLWHLRTGAGNGASVWTADELVNDSEDVAALVTAVTFAEGGGYRFFAYIWDSNAPDAEWDLRIRLGDEGEFITVQASEAETANPWRFNSAIRVEENSRRLIEIPLGVVAVSAGGTVSIHIDDDETIGLRRTWYDGIGYEKVFGTMGERIIAIDFNKTNMPGAPSQAMFRSIGGSSITTQNSTNLVKFVGDYAVQISKTSSLGFDFRGANRDSTRSTPGGPTSRSFLVSDFVGSRDGTLNVTISNLAAGTYLFRSYHLDSFTGANFGYAQGSSPTTRNTLRAFVGDALEAIVQPNALGSFGLNTTFISDTDIPQLSFPFVVNGTNEVQINLSTIYTNGSDRFIFMNGFEIFTTTP